MALLVCANCNAANPEDARFCLKCGKRIADDYIDPDLEQRLYERIETKLTSKWISKEAVEREIALNAAAKLSEWIKMFAIAIGVPATIAVGILAFVGIKSTGDLATIETQTANVKKTADDLTAQYKPLNDELPKLRQIVTEMHGLESRVSTVEYTSETTLTLTPEVAGQVRKLTQRIFNDSKSTDKAVQDELAAISKVLGVTKLDDAAAWQLAIRQALFKAVRSPADWAALQAKLVAANVKL